MFFIKASILLSYVIVIGLHFMLWKSKNNIVLILELPKFLIAYVGGTFFLFDETIDLRGINKSNLVDLAAIMLLGSLIYAFGYLVGFNIKSGIKKRFYIAIRKFSQVSSGDLLYKNSVWVHVTLTFSVLCIVFYLYSFQVMGFIPMFADNPFAAKYMAGEYQERYRPVAHFYRLALVLSAFTVPLLLGLSIWMRGVKKILPMLLLALILSLTILTLRRGLIATPALFFLLLYFVWYRNGKYVIIFTATWLLIWVLGSSINSIIATYIFGSSDSFKWISVVKGMPDIADLLWFWNEFIETQYPMSYGKTIYGGLIPYHYDWNPSVMTKLVVGSGKNVATGGFRLPFQVEGYYTFGWLGVVLWSFYYGVIGGIYLKLMRFVVESNYMSMRFVNFFFAIMLVVLVDMILHSLIKLQISAVVNAIMIAFILWLVFKRFNLSFGRSRNVVLKWDT